MDANRIVSSISSPTLLIKTDKDINRDTKKKNWLSPTEPKRNGRNSRFLTASSIWTSCRRNACTRCHPQPPPPSACSNTKHHKSDDSKAPSHAQIEKPKPRPPPQVRGRRTLTVWRLELLQAGSCWMAPARSLRRHALAHPWDPAWPGVAPPAPATVASWRSGWPPWEHEDGCAHTRVRVNWEGGGSPLLDCEMGPAFVALWGLLLGFWCVYMSSKKNIDWFWEVCGMDLFWFGSFIIINILMNLFVLQPFLWLGAAC